MQWHNFLLYQETPSLVSPIKVIFGREKTLKLTKLNLNFQPTELVPYEGNCVKYILSLIPYISAPLVRFWALNTRPKKWNLSNQIRSIIVQGLEGCTLGQETNSEVSMGGGGQHDPQPYVGRHCTTAIIMKYIEAWEKIHKFAIHTTRSIWRTFCELQCNRQQDETPNFHLISCMLCVRLPYCLGDAACWWFLTPHN